MKESPKQDKSQSIVANSDAVLDRLMLLPKEEAKRCAQAGLKDLDERVRCQNCLGISPETKIYRLMTFDRFRELLKEKKLVLVLPVSWNDPWEYCLLCINYIIRNEQTYEHTFYALDSMGESLYAQSWSLEAESDGLWRGYTPSKAPIDDALESHSIQIQTTVGALMKQVYQTRAIASAKSIYIGAVTYCPESVLLKKAGDFGMSLLRADEGVSADWNETVLATLFLKRDAFRYEREVRLVIDASANNKYRPKVVVPDKPKRKGMLRKENLLDVDIVPESLIQKVVADPWCSDAVIQKMQDEVKNLEYPFKVERSSLYNPPPAIIITKGTQGAHKIESFC